MMLPFIITPVEIDQVHIQRLFTETFIDVIWKCDRRYGVSLILLEQIKGCDYSSVVGILGNAAPWFAISSMRLLDIAELLRLPLLPAFCEASEIPGSECLMLVSFADQLINDTDNVDIVFHIADIVYSNRCISQWDQFTSQVEPIALVVPYMIASGSFYDGKDSGGECGIPAETTFYVPVENRAKLWYTTDYGMFRFYIADSEHDWREAV